MISARALAGAALLTLCAAIAVALALANGSSWPGALLAALGVCIPLVGVLLAAPGGSGGDDR